MNELRYQIEFHPRQREALDSDATEMLFGGASRGGKSHYARIALITWCLEIPGLQCKIFRKYSDDVISNHMESDTGFKVLLAPLVAAGLVQIVQTQIRFIFNGSLISLYHCQDEDVEKYQGRGTHVLVLDEATQLSERVIRFLRGWVTMPEEMKKSLPPKYQGKFPKILYTANPIGVSVGFFRRQFIKARPAFAIEKIGAFKRQFIPSRVEDNPSEDAQAARERLTDIGDEAMASALIEGNWDAPTGDFFPEYNEDRHVIADFDVPKHWWRYRTFDWGSADPFAVHWWAVSDGEFFDVELKVEENGLLVNRVTTLWFPRGALICYREWYGCNKKEPALGIGMRNEDIARGIIARSPEDYERAMVTLTDSFVFPDRGETGGQTIAKTFQDNGVPLTLGKTKRVTGWSQLRARLIGQKFDANDDKRLPLFYVMESCKYLREYLPALPRHPNEAKREDAAEHGEATHACDSARLAAMAIEIVREAMPPKFDTSKISNEKTFDDVLKHLRMTRDNGAAW